MTRKGFSLAELLIVIAIIGLLVSIVVPATARYAAVAGELRRRRRSLRLWRPRLEQFRVESQRFHQLTCFARGLHSAVGESEDFFSAPDHDLDVCQNSGERF